MWNGFRGVPLVVMAAVNLVSCDSAVKQAAAPVPEAEQVISAEMKRLYMATAAAAPQSPAQHKVLVEMAEKASNGKELLLVMRAGLGALSAGSKEEERVLHVVTEKMIRVATLNQMIEFATQYSLSAEDGRAVVQRMFVLGEGEADARAWYRIRVAASHLKVGDLERAAQDRGDQLAKR